MLETWIRELVRLTFSVSGICTTGRVTAVREGERAVWFVRMELSPVGVTDPAIDWLLSSLSVIVDVEGDRENVLASGPKWVSFSSGRKFVSAEGGSLE